MGIRYSAAFKPIRTSEWNNPTPKKILMKTNTKTLFAISALAGLSFTAAQAAIVTWTDASGENWDTTANWDTGVAPVNGDSVVLTERSVLNYDFTVQIGQSITESGGSYWLGMANSGWSGGPAALTLATGGSINVSTLNARGNSDNTSGTAPTFIIESGATLTTTTGGGGTRGFNTTWEAGASSVTTWNSAHFDLGLNHLTVDLTSYTAGAGSLTLVDYTTLGGTVFASVNVFDGSGTLALGTDYTLDYTTGSNITLNVIPEPGTYALIGGLLALGYVMVRRRA